jgi:hypothetical protein
MTTTSIQSSLDATISGMYSFYATSNIFQPRSGLQALHPHYYAVLTPPTSQTRSFNGASGVMRWRGRYSRGLSDGLKGGTKCRRTSGRSPRSITGCACTGEGYLHVICCQHVSKSCLARGFLGNIRLPRVRFPAPKKFIRKSSSDS